MQAAHAPAPLRHILVRIRLVSTFLVGALTYLVLPAWLDLSSRILTSWNVAIVLYLILVTIMMVRSTHESMRQRARQLDEGRHAVLLLAVAAALGSLVAIVFELYGLRNASPDIVALHIGLALSTIISAWSFVHVIFTEHYAHGFYRDLDKAEDVADEDRGKGLRFPGQPRPDYLDFLYFSFTIGVANQTADTEVVSRGMRVLVLIHSVISYFFNTIILALTINIAAGMLGG